VRRRLSLASLAALALSLAAPGPAREEPPSPTGPRAGAAIAPIASQDDVFSDRAIHRYALAMPPPRWQKALDHATAETWTAAQLSIDGARFGVVGVRFKGSMGTLGSCFEQGQRVCAKLPMKIRFDLFDESRRLFGLERLNFHAMGHDQSLMRERLAYGVFAAAGIPTPRTSWARLSVNGQDLGLFALVEEVDGRFSDRHFPADDGLLYKEAWPVSQDPDYYEARLRTNRGKPHRHDQVIAFARELADATSDPERVAVLERWTDVDALLRFMAADRLVGNWDGVTAWFCKDGPCTNHNYYWYAEKHRRRLWLLPWDLDDAFRLYDPLAAAHDWLAPAADCSARPLAWGDTPTRDPACDPLLRALAAASGS
jgi:spore coat protein CotH